MKKFPLLLELRRLWAIMCLHAHDYAYKLNEMKSIALHLLKDWTIVGLRQTASYFYKKKKKTDLVLLEQTGRVILTWVCSVCCE